MQKLIFIFLLFIACSANNIQPKQDIKRSAFALGVPTGSKFKLFIVAGQSNCGTYNTTALGTVDSVHSWNVNTFKWEKKVDVTQQYISGVGGFIVPLADKLQNKYPGDSLYFLQVHLAGTAMDRWNSNTGDYFFRLADNLDIALQHISFDEINLIWVQGENDAKTSAKAIVYNENEFELFHELNRRYGIIGKIIDYRLPSVLPIGTYPYKATVNTAKEWVRDYYGTVLINSDSFNYNTDLTHMSLTGIVQFADSCANHL